MGWRNNFGNTKMQKDFHSIETNHIQEKENLVAYNFVIRIGMVLLPSLAVSLISYLISSLNIVNPEILANLIIISLIASIAWAIICGGKISKKFNEKDATEKRMPLYTNRNNFEILMDKLEGNGYHIQNYASDVKYSSAIVVDQDHRKWAYLKMPSSMWEYSNNDLIEFQICEDGEKIISSNAAKAIAGGLLFGTIGAIAGASGTRTIQQPKCTELYIEITVNNPMNPTLIIPFIEKGSSPLFRGSKEYLDHVAHAKECIALLTVIKSNRDSETLANNPNTTDLDQLDKLFQLKEKGVITQKEFEAKKEELLFTAKK